MSGLGEQLAGAEFVASHEIVEDFGIWFELTDQMGKLAQDQARQWLEDQQQFASELVGGEPLQAIAEHAARSTQHCMNGMQSFMKLVATHNERASKYHQNVWRPFDQAFGQASDQER